ncbi:MAG: PhoX family phosphatase [Betaproteobacteria bacterium]|nr:PhoX family phosphatase [Betaproteobacteria bacterium]PWB60427.1 MAG: transcriptional initiation protein Tat [Betaproteobacteria bacterium]
MAYTIRDDDGVSNLSCNPHLTHLVEAAIAANPRRRTFLKTGLGAALLPFLGSVVACADSGGDGDEKLLGFAAVGTSTADTMVVPPGYKAEALVSWGDPLVAGAVAFKGDATETAAQAELQVGDNHDGMHFFGFAAVGGESSDRGLLVVNHEYINPEYYYAPGTDAANWMLPFTLEKARKGQAGHGLSVIEVYRKGDGSWDYVRGSAYNRRITGYTPMSLTGPARGHELLKTAADPSGAEVLGTLNNCAAGFTPWGTYLTCEENFNGYFGWNGTRTASALENRYGLAKDGFGYLWHTVDARFDLNAEANECNRFGWIVEVDPFNPTSKPRKRTALGRIKHENAELVVAPNGKVVVYTGDDERNEYIYKFVSSGNYVPGNAAANADLLDSGTLYVAKFDAGAAAGDRMGNGTWMPMVFGQGGLDASNGFTSQADILIRARQAADRLGATMMDRPEWIAANPRKPGEIYVSLTNNNRRGTTPASSNNPNGSTVAGAARPAVDDANPRADNVWGHVLRWNEANGDPTSTTFTWDIFVLAGNPKTIADRTNLRSGSANVTVDDMFNSPDGLQFDSSGRLWIQTDGSYANSGNFDGQGNNQMLAADVSTGEIRRFLVGPSACEITGVTWTRDRTTMFINIQHPGEIGGHPNTPKKADGSTYTNNDIAREPGRFSRFPAVGDATVVGNQPRPRPCTIVVRRTDGGVVGT